VTDKRVLVGDPGLGTRIVARNECEKMWNGLVFIIRNRSVRSQNNFNRLEEWRCVREKAPLGLALKNSDLASITMLLPGSGGVLP
jgi:predicted double-glycine peptidase